MRAGGAAAALLLIAGMGVTLLSGRSGTSGPVEQGEAGLSGESAVRAARQRLLRKQLHSVGFAACPAPYQLVVLHMTWRTRKLSFRAIFIQLIPLCAALTNGPTFRLTCKPSGWAFPPLTRQRSTRPESPYCRSPSPCGACMPGILTTKSRWTTRPRCVGKLQTLGVFLAWGHLGR